MPEDTRQPERFSRTLESFRKVAKPVIEPDDLEAGNEIKDIEIVGTIKTVDGLANRVDEVEYREKGKTEIKREDRIRLMRRLNTPPVSQ